MGGRSRRHVVCSRASEPKLRPECPRAGRVRWPGSPLAVAPRPPDRRATPNTLRGASFRGRAVGLAPASVGRRCSPWASHAAHQLPSAAHRPPDSRPLGCPRPTGSPAAFPCPRPHFLRGMVSLFNLSCPLPNTPPSYLPPDGAAKGALAGRAPFNTRGADSGVAGGGGGGVTRSSALISPGPVSPKTEALRARAVHQRPLDELDAALVCRG